MSVLLDATVRSIVFAHHACHIAHACHLARDWSGEDNLVGDLFLAVLGILYMYWHLLVIVAETAAHGGDALWLQTAKEHLLTDAVGLQALAVHIE